jgi:5-methylcytosine-specific restriction protein A
MPSAPPKPCSHPGCGVLVRDGTGRCPKHPRADWRKKVDAPKRMTGRKLQAARARLFTANPLCVECDKHGRVRLATQRDHRVPLSEGGADDDSNVQGLCDDCHEEKSLGERLRAQSRARGQG